MKIYYKRVITWQKWPDNDVIDADLVEYSLGKNKWNCIHTTEPSLTMPDRIKSVASALRIKPSKITLVKP